MKRLYPLLILATLFGALIARADATLSLGDFLSQVKAKNGAVKGAIATSKAQSEKRQDKDLAYAPALFANVTLAADSKLPQLPFFNYDQLTSHTYQLGVSKLTSFGLGAKLYYELDYTNFKNAVFPGGGAAGGPGFPLTFYDARPVIELSQSIWGNGFGRGARASSELADAQSSATEAMSRYQARGAMLQAETAYWRLAVAREAIVISRDALDDAEKIFDYTSKRSRMHLGENSDELQSRAAKELRRLDVKSAEDEERAAARAFNALRNVRSEEVTETLISLKAATDGVSVAPKRAATRDDVEAARHQQRATAAAADLLVEKDTPTLDIVASFALNGRDTTVGGALGDPYHAGRPTKMVGLKLNVPLDLSATSEARRGAIHERDAAEMIYQQKIQDQETSWDDLTHKLGEARERLVLSETIEKAQESKLENERGRLRNGRTTTYQVLLFEQDFASSQAARLRAQADVLSILTQMKLYSGEEL